MKIAVEYTQHLNPGQIAVGCSDQPLYALMKTIQLAYPDEFGTNYFCFMGGLQVEQAALVCIGQLITGSGNGGHCFHCIIRDSWVENCCM